jgi:hypothetical protein
LNQLQGTIGDLEKRLTRFTSLASEELVMAKGIVGAPRDTRNPAAKPAATDLQAEAAARAAYQPETAAAAEATPVGSETGTETAGTDIQSTGTVHVLLEEDNYYERRAGLRNRMLEAQAEESAASDDGEDDAGGDDQIESDTVEADDVVSSDGETSSPDSEFGPRNGEAL